MKRESYLFVTDAHGDPNSLRAVIALAENRGPIDKRIFLGDAIGYGDDPGGILEILQTFDVLIKGNHEALALGEVDGAQYSQRAFESIYGHLDQIGEEGLAFLKSFRPIYEEGSLLAFHGTPDSALDYPFNEVDIRGIFERYPTPDLMIGGHLHIPRLAKFDVRDGAIGFEDVSVPYSGHTLNLATHRYFVNCPSATPGRFGYSHPGCCRLERKTDSTFLLEFLFIT
jgi:hypothetical protein